MLYFCERSYWNLDKDCTEATGCLILFYPVSQNGVLLGAVGSFDWAGGAFLHVSKDKFTFINTTRIDADMNDAYLGKWKGQGNFKKGSGYGITQLAYIIIGSFLGPWNNFKDRNFKISI